MKELELRIAMEKIETLIAYTSYLATMLDKSITYSERIASVVNDMNAPTKVFVKETNIRSVNAGRVS